MAKMKVITEYRQIIDRQAEAIGALLDGLSDESAFIKREDFANGVRMFNAPKTREQRRAMLLAAADRCRAAAEAIPTG